MRATPQQAFVRQIFHNEETRAQLDPGFLPLDNAPNLRPDWSEYWPIRQFVRSNSFFRDAGYGFFSPKFAAKTRLPAADIATGTAAIDRSPSLRLEFDGHVIRAIGVDGDRHIRRGAELLGKG